MIELTTLTLICILLLVYFRPGKIAPLDSPLIIERAGRYRAILAPQLNLVQPFIEKVAGCLDVMPAAQSGGKMYAFEVRDKQATAAACKCYVLLIEARDGLLHFEAALAPSALSRFQAASPDTRDSEPDCRVTEAVQAAARQCGVEAIKFDASAAVLVRPPWPREARSTAYNETR